MIKHITYEVKKLDDISMINSGFYGFVRWFNGHEIIETSSPGLDTAELAWQWVSKEIMDLENAISNNINNLKRGDKIFVEQAWEDDTGAYHDEIATVISIGDDGELTLDFKDAHEAVRSMLKDSSDYFANDFKKYD